MWVFVYFQQDAVQLAYQNPSAELDKSSTIKNPDVNAGVPA